MASRHVERCSISLIREMPVKTIQGVTTSHWSEWPSFKKKSRKNKCWRGCGEKGTLLHVGRSVNWSSHYGEQYGGTSKTKSHAVWSHHIIQQSYSWAYINKTVIQKDTRTLLFIAALFTKAKTWKPKDMETKAKTWKPFTGRWMEKKMWYEKCSHKNEWNNAMCSNTDRAKDDLSKVSQKEKGKYCIISPICGI